MDCCLVSMQNYSNHSRLNPLHHFILLPVSVFLFIWSLIHFVTSTNTIAEKVFYITASICIVVLGLIARIYALKNQDRLIRVEMRLRFFELTGTSFSTTEKKLHLGQIIALRFASDDELIELINKTIHENLSNKEIEKLIKNWQADLNRV